MLDSITIYVLAVVFFATLVRSTLGFGEALVAVPQQTQHQPHNNAAPQTDHNSVGMASVIVVQDWREMHLRSASGLILAALPGIPLGIALLAKGNEHVVKLILGFIYIGFSL